MALTLVHSVGVSVGGLFLYSHSRPNMKNTEPDKRKHFIFTHPADALTTSIPKCASLLCSVGLGGPCLRLPGALESGAKQDAEM